MGCQIQITKKNAITPRPDKIWQYTPYILTDDLCISQHKQINVKVMFPLELWENNFYQLQKVIIHLMLISND